MRSDPISRHGNVSSGSSSSPSVSVSSIVSCTSVDDLLDSLEPLRTKDKTQKLASRPRFTSTFRLALNLEYSMEVTRLRQDRLPQSILALLDRL